MKKSWLLSIIVFCFGITAFTQKVDEKDLKGVWMATNVPASAPKFELTFLDNNIVHVKVNEKVTVQRFDIDPASNLIQIKIRTTESGDKPAMIMLVKYVDAGHLKMQTSLPPNLKTTWNKTETTNNTGVFTKKE